MGPWYARGGAATLAQRLRVRFPIVQAPMVGVSTPELAAAVSNADALGSIGLGACGVGAARNQIRAVRALTDKPFNANFFCHEPHTADPSKEKAWLAHLAPLFAEFDATPPTSLSSGYDSFLAEADAMTEMLLAEKPSVVSFHFGLPSHDTIKALRGAGMIVMGCVTSPHEAALASEAGVDVMICQGYEAGGHRGVFDPSKDKHIGTLALVQLVAKQSKVPVVAAGGIMNGKGIAAALQLGASGVQLGTAFILCPESSADRAFRDALQNDERTYNTAVSPAISGRPARGLVNRAFTDIGSHAANANMPAYPLPYSSMKALDHAARARGNTQFAVQWAGQAAPLARAMPAAQLVQTLVSEVNDNVN